jgi:hypothetical protein
MPTFMQYYFIWATLVLWAVYFCDETTPYIGTIVRPPLIILIRWLYNAMVYVWNALLCLTRGGRECKYYLVWKGV